MMTTPTAVLAGRDYLNLPDAQEPWIVEDVLPEGGALLIYGDAKIGKSFAAIQLADAIASGHDAWLGFPIRKHGTVVYVQYDTPRSLWLTRLRQLDAAGETVENIHYLDRESLGIYPFNILDPLHKARLQDALRPLNPLVVVVDVIREVHTADENDSTEMQAAIAQIVDACAPSAVILISHPKKPSADLSPNLIHDIRGSGYMSGRVDAIFRFTPATLYFQGRSLEKDSIKLERADNGYWLATEHDLDRWVDGVLADDNYPTTKAKAKRLAELSGKKPEACRSYLRRVVRATTPGTTRNSTGYGKAA